MTLLAQRVSFDYGRATVVDDVTLEVRPGEVKALVGPNGAGKSTLLRLLSGVARPSHGNVLLDGASLRRLGRREVARRLAVAQQGGELPEGFRVSEIVAMGRAPHLGLLRSEGAEDLAMVESAMSRTAVLSLRDRRVWQLSGGEKQRVVLARALAQQPRYLLLDEPTTHLDLRHQVEILRHVREQAACGIGVLVVLHDLNLAARGCDRVVVLASGRVEAEGTPAEVLDSDLLGRIYGTEIERVDDGSGQAPALLPRLNAKH